jgi:hypothetical protein
VELIDKQQTDGAVSPCFSGGAARFSKNQVV